MPEDVFVYLGQCLRDAREECGLTQQELADQTGAEGFVISRTLKRAGKIRLTMYWHPLSSD